MHTRFFGVLCAATVLSRSALTQQPEQRQAQQLDTVEVAVASHTHLSVVALSRSVQVISREEIRALGARTLQDVLNRALSLDVLNRSAASADVAIRGTSLGQVLVLVDGVRMTDRQTPHFDLDVAVPLTQVQRIEILRGAASAQYGADAVGGVINVVTARTPRDEQVEAYDDRVLVARAYAGNFGMSGAAIVLPIVAASHDRSAGHRAGTDHRSTLVRAALGSAAFGGSVGQAVRDFGANSFYGPFDSHERTATTTGELHGARAMGEALGTQVSLSTRRHADQFTLRRTDPAFYRNRHVSVQSSLTTVVRYGSSLAVGAQVDDARLISARLGDRHDVTGAAFAQASVARSSRAWADVGLRSDWSNGFGTFVSPSVAASMLVNERTSVRASASRAFRAPSWTERFYTDPANVGTPTLQAERFALGEVGVRAFPRWGGRLDAAMWVRRGHDVIDWSKPSDTLTAPWRTRNYATIDYRGGEAELELPSIAGVSLAAHASLLRFNARSASGFTGKYALRPITSAIGARAGVATWQTLAFVVEGRRFRRAGDDRGHLEASAHLRFHLAPATLEVHLENLAQANYLDVSGKPVAGRNVSVALSWP